MGAAEKEGEFSRETARDATYADRPDQNTAFGNTRWQQQKVKDPATGQWTTKWTQNQALSGDQQEIFDYQTQRNADMAYMAAGKGSQIQQEMSQPLDWGQFGEAVAGPNANLTGGDYLNAATGRNVGAGLQATTGDEAFTWDSQNRQRAEDASYGRATQRLDTQFDADRTKLERKMSERGLRVGDSAYDSAMNNFNTGRNDAYEMARMGATAEGRQEDQQSYGQAQGAYGMNRQAEQQRFGQNQSVAQNSREADQQRFNQLAQQQAANTGVKQQQYTQQAQSAETANALRDQQISEYLSKRGQGLKEANALSGSMNTAEMSSTYGGGGE